MPQTRSTQRRLPRLSQFQRQITLEAHTIFNKVHAKVQKDYKKVCIITEITKSQLKNIKRRTKQKRDAEND